MAVDLGRIGRALSGCGWRMAKKGKKAISHHFGAAETTLSIYRSQGNAQSSTSISIYFVKKTRLVLDFKREFRDLEGLTPFSYR